MPNVSSGNKFFINDFDNDDFDALLIDVVNAVWDDDYDVLEFWVNSEGGDVTRALSLVELIALAKSRGKTVETFVLSQAYSAGSLVAVAGSEGHRWVARDGCYMLHYGTVEITATNPVDLQNAYNANHQHFMNIHSHFTKYTKISKLHDKLMTETYVNSIEAQMWGMADGLIEDYK